MKLNQLRDNPGARKARKIYNQHMQIHHENQSRSDRINHMKKLYPGDCNHKKDVCEGYAVRVDIDPRLFGKYWIDSVPAVVFTRGVTMQEGEGKGCGLEEGVNNYKIFGDAKLSFLLESINREAKSQSLAKVVRALEGGYYAK